jgi:hypothetical protein
MAIPKTRKLHGEMIGKVNQNSFKSPGIQICADWIGEEDVS